MSTLTELQMVYPEIPPTSNKIYFQGTRLTQHARTYAENFAKYMFEHYGPEAMQLDKTSAYYIGLRFYFDTLENESFNNPDVPASKRAKSWYKKIDLTNRIKLLEDCIRDFIDIDDSQTFSASQEKYQDPGNERVEIHIVAIDATRYGLRRR